MAESSRHDAWQAGDSYDAYMGRWSRQVAPLFLAKLGVLPGLEWFEVGCGTGALSEAILASCAPRSLLAIDASPGFIEVARANVEDERVRFEVGDAQGLQANDATSDVAVSALTLNFVPDRAKALSEMKRVVRPGGTVAFYVWDYPGAGVEFMRAFWSAATALDPEALDLAEGHRFPFCTREGLIGLAEQAGLESVACTPIEAPTVFRDFDDFWHPFTLGAGPAPGYCAKLAPAARERLRRKLSDDLVRNPDGTIPLKVRAWAVMAKV